MNIIYYDFMYFVFVLIIFFIIILSSRAIFKRDFTNIPVKNLHYDEINSGDLLFVHYDKRYILQSSLGLRFGHVAICSREDSNLYVYEYTNYFDKYYGFLKIPFSEWLKYNKKHTIAINKLRISNDSKYKRKLLSEKIRQYRRKNLSYNFIDFNEYIHRFLLNKNGPYLNQQKEDNTMCYEMIIHLLIYLKIIKSLDHNLSIYNPDDLVYMNKFKVNYNYDYSSLYISNVDSLKFICD